MALACQNQLSSGLFIFQSIYCSLFGNVMPNCLTFGHFALLSSWIGSHVVLLNNDNYVILHRPIMYGWFCSYGSLNVIDL